MNKVDNSAFLDAIKQNAAMIAMQKEHMPMLAGMMRNGDFPLASLASIPKEYWREVTHIFLRETDPICYAFISEAYMASVAKDDDVRFDSINREGVASLPPDDRTDILMIVFCENNGKVRLLTAKVHPENAGARVVSDWDEGTWDNVIAKHVVLKW